MILARVRARLSPLGRLRGESVGASDVIDSPRQRVIKEKVSFIIYLFFIAKEAGTPMTHPLRCTCGAVTGTVAHERLANHGICYCVDCQAFARFLDRDAELLDARGGCESIPVLPKDVTFHQGVQHLACVRLSETGPLRWYAACCNTPIGGTAATSKLPFLGLSRACLESTAPSVAASFGAVQFCLYASGARGQPKPKPFGRVGFALWLICNRLRARFTGGFKENPLFDTARNRPIAEPNLLSTADRTRLG
jgi:hypothetical protein